MAVRVAGVMAPRKKQEFDSPDGRLWGCSSTGRAPALQAGGSGFDPHQLHHMFHWSNGRAPASGAGDVGSIPAWDKLMGLLIRDDRRY